MTVLILTGSPAAQESKALEPDNDKVADSSELPNIADLIPLASELSGRLAILEKKIAVNLQVSAVEEEFSKIVANVEDHAAELRRFKALANYRYRHLLELMEALDSEGKSLAAASEPLIHVIRQLGASRTSWSDERKRWDVWQSFFSKDESLDEIQAAFTGVQATIDRAQNLITQHLRRLLVVQQKAGIIQSRINVLMVEVEGLIVYKHGYIKTKSSPPFFSKRYFDQFESVLWYAFRRGLTDVSWPGKQYFVRQGWVVFSLGLLSLVLATIIFMYRRQLEGSESWRFVGKRPFAAGFFVCFASFNFLYTSVPSTVAFAVYLVAVISFARIIRFFLEKTWMRLIVGGMLCFLATTRLLYMINLPLPLFRLYFISAALAGLAFCLWQIVAGRRRKESRPVIWAFRFGFLFLAVMLALEFWGVSHLSEFIFESAIRTIIAIQGAWLLILLAHGGIEWMVQKQASQIFNRLQYNTDKIVQRLALGVNVLIGVFALARVLVIWRVFDAPDKAIEGVLSFGFSLGTQKVSVGLILAVIGILYGSFFISWALQRLLAEQVFARGEADPGIRFSATRLIHYVVIIIGFFIALGALGLDMTKITIIFGALSVGIGFGLQTIVNNFISGIIMLFERPVKVGDYIELNGQWAEIKKIGLRSTVVETFDRSEIVVPNSNLISNEVTNWTLSNRSMRLTIPVGVAYGSDVPLVLETLIECAQSNPKLMRNPEPQVLFMSFGESTLDFVLRVWIWNIDDMMPIRSELHQEIDRRFREVEIEIALPQRDLHLRSVERSIQLQQISPENQRPDLTTITRQPGDGERV
jgi:small-conductance mechanosensitive channel